MGGELNCVLVNVCGLKLAIPFESIEGALSLSTVTLQLENNYEWLLGSFARGSIQSQIVDTGCWILSDRYDPAKSRYAELLVLEGKRWALTCDVVEKSVRIPHSSININAEKQNRPWLLGTYMQERCAVVDVDALIKQLELASGNR
ncbi:chemotaxis protein CheW [Neptunomonas qingdaonensis]|nr:chemotaxis protein CheW [Neptunomonas qingdaonensis]